MTTFQFIILTDAILLAQADDAVVILDKELVELYLMPFLQAISLAVSVKAKNMTILLKKNHKTLVIE